MFNDLNQTGQSEPKAAVDDIFSDVDKTTEAKNFSGYYANSNAPATPGIPSEIETQKVGLSETENLPVSSKGKILKIGLIVLLVLLLCGLGYLIYVKFLSGASVDQGTVVNKVAVVNTQKATTTTSEQDLNATQATTTDQTQELVTTTTTTTELATSTASTTVTGALVDSDNDGLSDEEEKILGTDPNVKDTDGDGLSDYDEVKTYSTDPLKIDTDGDGLSDYEEVKIYQSDPLKADTDGDGYTDGAEVKSGYDPLLPGKKMSDTQKTTIVK